MWPMSLPLGDVVYCVDAVGCVDVVVLAIINDYVVAVYTDVVYCVDVVVGCYSVALVCRCLRHRRHRTVVPPSSAT